MDDAPFRSGQKNMYSIFLSAYQMTDSIIKING